MSKQPHINETLEKLTELVHGQQKALDMANKIISMKNQMIKLCEEELDTYKRDVKSYYIISIVLSASLAISLFMHIFK